MTYLCKWSWQFSNLIENWAVIEADSASEAARKFAQKITGGPENPQDDCGVDVLSLTALSSFVLVPKFSLTWEVKK